MKSYEPLISIIVPVYNGSHSIGHCVNALEKQTYPKSKYEIIIVDDGSTDGMAGVLRNSQVRYYRQENKGPATARNKGVDIAKGDIILFTDSDCIPDKNWIKEMVSSFQDPEIIGVKGAYKTKQRALWARFTQIEFNDRYDFLSKNKYIDMVATYSAGYRKDIFLSMKGFDVSFPFPNGEDADLSYRLHLQGYRMVFNPKAIVWHAGHPDTLIKYMRKKFWRGYWRIVVYRKNPIKIIKDTYTPQTLKFQIVFIILSTLSLAFMLFFPLEMFYLFSLNIILFIIFSIPFITKAIMTDIVVGLLSPFFLFLRGFSLGAGVLYRLWQEIFCHV